jgi:hypothetical protein
LRGTATLAALLVSATCAAPAFASASSWRTDGNDICGDYYDRVALVPGDELTPALVNELARLTERKDARLARLDPPAADAARLRRLVRGDRRSARTLREIGRKLNQSGAEAVQPLLKRYEGEVATVLRLARSLHLETCAGGGDAVTGPAEEL